VVAFFYSFDDIFFAGSFFRFTGNASLYLSMGIKVSISHLPSSQIVVSVFIFSFLKPNQGFGGVP